MSDNTAKFKDAKKRFKDIRRIAYDRIENRLEGARSIIKSKMYTGNLTSKIQKMMVEDTHDYIDSVSNKIKNIFEDTIDLAVDLNTMEELQNDESFEEHLKDFEEDLKDLKKDIGNTKFSEEHKQNKWVRMAMQKMKGDTTRV